MKRKNKHNSNCRLRRIIGAIIIVLLLLIGWLCSYSAKWVSTVYGNIGFNAILYTMFSDLNGVQSGLVSSYVRQALLPSLLITAGIGFLLIFSSKKRIVACIREKHKIVLYPFYPIFSLAVALVFCVVLVWNGGRQVHFFPWLDGVLHAGNFYEEEYVDPSAVKIEFPEQKHNLIYIYLESMETTFLSEDLGGGG